MKKMFNKHEEHGGGTTLMSTENSARQAVVDRAC